jgi:hypothetical protein
VSVKLSKHTRTAMTRTKREAAFVSCRVTLQRQHLSPKAPSKSQRGRYNIKDQGETAAETAIIQHAAKRRRESPKGGNVESCSKGCAFYYYHPKEKRGR